MKNMINIFILIKKFLKEYKLFLTVILTFLLIINILKRCEKEPKETTKISINIEKIKDSIKQVLLKEIEPVYIDTGSTKYVKGDKVIEWKDNIVYVPILDSENKSHTIKANIYKYDLKSNNATAKINITSQTEPLEITGLIEYPEKTTTKTLTKYKNSSGLFLYGNAPINTDYLNAEIGLFYQFKNKIGVMSGLEYNNLTNSLNIKVGVAFKLY